MDSFLLIIIIIVTLLQISVIRDLNKTIKEIPSRVCDLILASIQDQVMSLKKQVEEIKTNVEINKRE